VEPGGPAGRRPRPPLRVLLRSPHLWAAVLLLGLVAAGLVLAVPRLRAWQNYRAARADLEHYHNRQAIDHLQVCLHLWPDDPDVLLLTARAARRAGAYADAERALARYQQARGLDEAGSFEQLLLSAERHVDKVAEVCRGYVEKNHPDAPLVLEALVRGFLRQYRLREARFCLDRWLALHPENPQALYLEGQFHLDYEHAVATGVDKFRHALRVDAEHEEARLGLAIALLEAKSFHEALEHLEYLRQRQPDNLRVRVGLAECRDGLGDREEAQRLVEEVLAEEPHFWPALALRGRLALEGGQLGEAEAWLKEAVAQNPGNHQAEYNLIVCLHQNGKDDEAEEHQKRLTQREEDLKRFNEIITQELGRRPHDPELHCTLGQLLLRSGYRDEGLRWLNNALAQDPQYAPARRALADYYRQAAPGQPQRK
jgi:predicted Zn-dependent protease